MTLLGGLHQYCHSKKPNQTKTTTKTKKPQKQTNNKAPKVKKVGGNVKSGREAALDVLPCWHFPRKF